MKLKVKLTKIPNWDGMVENEVNTELDIPDSIFDPITRSRTLKKKTMWYATLDGKLIVNHKGKSTYTSETKLIQGLSWVFDSIIRSNIWRYHNYPGQIRVDFEPNDIISQLVNEGRLKYHSFEIEEV